MGYSRRRWQLGAKIPFKRLDDFERDRLVRWMKMATFMHSFGDLNMFRIMLQSTCIELDRSHLRRQTFTRPNHLHPVYAQTPARVHGPALVPGPTATLA